MAAAKHTTIAEGLRPDGRGWLRAGGVICSISIGIFSRLFMSSGSICVPGRAILFFLGREPVQEILRVRESFAP